jgi:hypothetical protein
MLLVAAVVAAAAAAAEAQSLEEKLAKKLESEFLKRVPWITDYTKALAESKKTGKPIFGYFTRSYSP